MVTTDKEVAMVICNRKKYTNKEENLLEQKDIYRTLTTDPTKKQNKKNLTNPFQSIFKGAKYDGMFPVKMFVYPNPMFLLWTTQILPL